MAFMSILLVLFPFLAAGAVFFTGAFLFIAACLVVIGLSGLILNRLEKKGWSLPCCSVMEHGRAALRRGHLPAAGGLWIVSGDRVDLLTEAGTASRWGGCSVSRKEKSPRQQAGDLKRQELTPSLPRSRIPLPRDCSGQTPASRRSWGR